MIAIARHVKTSRQSARQPNIPGLFRRRHRYSLHVSRPVVSTFYVSNVDLCSRVKTAHSATSRKCRLHLKPGRRSADAYLMLSLRDIRIRVAAAKMLTKAALDPRRPPRERDAYARAAWRLVSDIATR